MQQKSCKLFRCGPDEEKRMDNAQEPSAPKDEGLADLISRKGAKPGQQRQQPGTPADPNKGNDGW